jgi:hypothetical protein
MTVFEYSCPIRNKSKKDPWAAFATQRTCPNHTKIGRDYRQKQKVAENQFGNLCYQRPISENASSDDAGLFDCLVNARPSWEEVEGHALCLIRA